MGPTFKTNSPKVKAAILSGREEGVRVLAVKITGRAVKIQQPDTGRLRSSIQWKDGTGQASATGEQLVEVASKGEAVVGSPLDYSVYQELGTRYMPAQPFLAPAVDMVINGTQGEQAMKTALENSVKKVVPKA